MSAARELRTSRIAVAMHKPLFSFPPEYSVGYHFSPFFIHWVKFIGSWLPAGLLWLALLSHL